MFNFFQENKKVEGLIKFYNLQEWWFESFDENERNSIADNYITFGTSQSERPLTNGKQNDIRPDFIFLVSLSQFFNTKSHFKISYPMIKEAELRFNGNANVLDLHFYFGDLLSFYYKFRDANLKFYENAKDYAIKQINIANESKNAFQEKYESLPTHLGYKQLCIILEKERKFMDAILLAEQAKNEGWNGDWEKRIEKLKKYCG